MTKALSSRKADQNERDFVLTIDVSAARGTVGLVGGVKVSLMDEADSVGHDVKSSGVGNQNKDVMFLWLDEFAIAVVVA